MRRQSPKVYAVFEQKQIVYLGEDEEIAELHHQRQEGNIMLWVETLSDIQYAWDQVRAGHELPGAKVYRPDQLAETITKAKAKIKEVMVDTFGFNEGAATVMANEIKEFGEELVDECRTMGIKSVKAIGSGLKTLGEFFEKME
jgi:hypothetical protein